MGIKNLLKRMAPAPVLTMLRNIKTGADFALLRVVAGSGLASSAYYLFFSKAFRREHRAVIQGRLKYAESLRSAQSNRYLLRRNIHRLEKGLLMRPRRDVFALDYIEETIACFDQVRVQAEAGTYDREEFKWAQDVLERYFSVVGPHATLERMRAERLVPRDDSGEPYVPYHRNLELAAGFGYQDMLDLARRRRSVRWFRQQPVPREEIDKAIAVAALSPSACNRQPFEFRIFDDPTLVRRVSTLPQGTRGFAENIPVVIVVVGKLGAYYSERDRHVIYIDASLAAMSLMFALETLGLSSCPINWPDIEHLEIKMQQTLDLEPDERPIMLIAVGYPDPEGLVAYSQKKSLDEIRRYN